MVKLAGQLMTGQYNNPIAVVAFNLAERWANDVSEDVRARFGAAPIWQVKTSRHRLRSSLTARPVASVNWRCVWSNEWIGE